MSVGYLANGDIVSLLRNATNKKGSKSCSISTKLPTTPTGMNHLRKAPPKNTTIVKNNNILFSFGRALNFSALSYNCMSKKLIYLIKEPVRKNKHTIDDVREQIYFFCYTLSMFQQFRIT